MVWINAYPNELPDITTIRYEELDADRPGMAVSAIEGAAIVENYIDGTHKGEYQFKLIYRCKPGNSVSKRLDAVETLNRIGEWATQQTPNFGEGLYNVTIEPTTRGALFAAYPNGDEDYQILMRLTYNTR